MSYKKASEIDFNKTISENKFVVLDFSANWCGPCKMFSPIFEEISKEYSDKVEFVKVDVDDCPEIAKAYNIRSIPTLIAVKEGDLYNNVIGLLSKSKFKEFVESLLS